MWGHTWKGRTRSHRISSLLSGPWATKTSQQPRLSCPRSEYAAQHAGAFCFNLPLTSLQPCFSKSGLNEPQGRKPHKHNKFVEMYNMNLTLLHGTSGRLREPTLSPLLHGTGKRQEEGGGRQTKERDTKQEKKVRGGR